MLNLTRRLSMCIPVRAPWNRVNRRTLIITNYCTVVRRHPVTGEEALYVNKEFTRDIVGLKHEESGTLPYSQIFDGVITVCSTETILNFLYDHMARAADAQVRISWQANSSVISPRPQGGFGTSMKLNSTHF